ncbi:LCP family protein [Metabacillus idriensis]|uniref:LCP family glycopolymer transferase n=1 Tax=Metabacillus idriensis TaxID=324768 RepID=UPI00174CC15C|nr:LCP family protein [Metabacillus idriensis]
MDRTVIRKKKKNKKRRRIFFILIPLLLIFFSIVGYGAYLALKVANVSSESQKDLERGSKSEMRDEAVDPTKDNFSVLFIGVDEREGETNSRSDALILVTFNKEDKTVKMVSIPRDSRVKIPGRAKKDKITHAHAFGGVDLTVATVEELLDVPVDYYTKLNFSAFMDIVDALGGITVNSSIAFTEQDSNDQRGKISISKGEQTLDGEEALAYVRMRKKDPTGDIGRGERQKEVIKAIINKSASLSSITKYDDLIDSIGDNLTTNFSIGNILALQKYSGSLNSIESIPIEGYDDPYNGVYYYHLEEESLEEVTDELKSHLNIN